MSDSRGKSTKSSGGRDNSGTGNGSIGNGGNGNGTNGGNQTDTSVHIPMGRGRGRGVVDEYAQRVTTTDSESAKRSESENENDQTKRGRTREGRIIQELLTTKPKHVESKKGKDGQQIQVLTNHFRLNFNHGFEVRHYRVDFDPVTDDLRIRRQCLAHLSPQLRAFIYDGANILYMTYKMPQTETSFVSQARDGTQYRVIIKDTVTTIKFTEAMELMVLNTMLRRAMDGLNLQLVQRNLYDPRAPIYLREFKLQLWPGYNTSIRQYEHDVLISCEISHKVMRLETVLNVLSDLSRAGGNFRELFEKEIVGTIILTDYNNQTYSICEIKWDMNPTSTFPTCDGGQISFIDYYQQKHSRTIRDRQQPLLVARLSARDYRAGRQTQPILQCVAIFKS